MLELKLKETSGPLPTSTYELVDNDLVIGKSQLRHRPSNGVGIPENMASHIYYEIDSQYRNKGYGTKILKLTLEKAKEIGLKEVFITSMKKNIGSKKIIEANHGIFIDQAYIADKDDTMLKYKIVL